MMALLDELRCQVLQLEVRLFACRERLLARTDSEALHDLRIALRRLRSLLRPLRSQAHCARLEQAAAALALASGPLRDLEVLLAELQARGLGEPQRQRRAQLAQGYTRLLDGLALQRLLILLEAWPADCREALRDGEWQVGGKQVRHYLQQQGKLLAASLRDSAHDLHRLRLLIKRLRYCAEAYPRQAELNAACLKALVVAQGALGDWHDRQQWLARGEQERDLDPCIAAWREELAQAEQAADRALEKLLEFF
ncbi:MAG TPA: CHAD domain-containing protein [Pseudomonas sp.]|nr:CHAD domain-containing protein [Pseudomonas sp.]